MTFRPLFLRRRLAHSCRPDLWSRAQSPDVGLWFMVHWHSRMLARP